MAGIQEGTVAATVPVFVIEAPDQKTTKVPQI